VTVAGLLLFTTLPFINAGLEVLFRSRIDNEFQGRLWSLISLFTQLGLLTALATAGTVADRVLAPLLRSAAAPTGPAAAIIISGLLLAVVAAGVRHVGGTRPADGSPAPEMDGVTTSAGA
jgi:hypothetical protein